MSSQYEPEFATQLTLEEHALLDDRVVIDSLEMESAEAEGSFEDSCVDMAVDMAGLKERFLVLSEGFHGCLSLWI